MRNLFSIGGAYWKLVQERASLCHGSEGIVSREQNALGSYLKKQIQKGRKKIKATNAIVEILTEIGANGTLQGCELLGQREFESRYHKREAFS